MVTGEGSGRILLPTAWEWEGSVPRCGWGGAPCPEKNTMTSEWKMGRSDFSCILDAIFAVIENCTDCCTLFQCIISVSIGICCQITVTSFVSYVNDFIIYAVVSVIYSVDD